MAINSELNYLKKNDTWDLVPSPETIHCFEMGIRKYLLNGKTDIYKTRFCQMFSQVKGEDYEETFPSASRFDIIKNHISNSSPVKMRSYAIDVKTTFLYGNLLQF
ncbi:hypothetical protein NPIL_565781 [Nephila pilipes]|uniref:Uncharacterized protein n=1 Tax=Nephila pilipes TaxID=299642 RepID=A0A8X6U567_NEPPI|nr:hypothetical protein NPIL_565781 [Nephila pilipes]